MNKDATWAEDFKRKIKDNINYAGYVLKHKSNIIEPMTQMNLPLSQSLAHDISKFRPSQFGPYRDWFFGPQGRTALEPSPEVFSKWRSAVRQHYKGNAHHWKKLGKDPEQVPLNTRMETVADWYAVGKTLRGSRGYPTFKNWYTKRREKLPIDPTTKTIIDYNLGLLKTSNFIIDKHTESPIAGLSKSKALKALIGQKEGVTVPMGLSKADMLMTKNAIAMGGFGGFARQLAAGRAAMRTGMAGVANFGLGKTTAAGAAVGGGLGALKKNDQGQRGNIGSILGGVALGAGAGVGLSMGAAKMTGAPNPLTNLFQGAKATGVSNTPMLGSAPAPKLLGTGQAASAPKLLGPAQPNSMHMGAAPVPAPSFMDRTKTMLGVDKPSLKNMTRAERNAYLDTMVNKTDRISTFKKSRALADSEAFADAKAGIKRASLWLTI